MAQQATKSIRESDIPVEPSERTITEEDIAALAYQLWQDRGCPVGSPDEDWYRAEEALNHLDPAR